MLKSLFGSKTRIKILRIFLLHPDEEYYVRELTRKLGEQINGIRRELENLKKIGLLKYHAKDRTKCFYINQEFEILPELQSIFMKINNDKKSLVDSIANIGNVDLLILSGTFMNNKQSPVDIFVVGDANKDNIANYIDSITQSNDKIRYSIMSKENFLYRLQFNDSFVLSLINDSKNKIVINKLKKYLKKS